MLRGARQSPDAFTGLAGKLVRAMRTGGMVGFEPVAGFNGNLFNDAQALPLSRASMSASRSCSKRTSSWRPRNAASCVEPRSFGRRGDVRAL